MTEKLKIHWPKHYAPNVCPVHVSNELTVSATPEQVWAWLVRAMLWSTWYANATNVQILGATGLDLNAGTRFRWKTFGISITSTVLEYVPFERIAWDAHGFGVDAYHAWVLQPEGQGCHVFTEEAQHGWLARLSNLAMPNRMHNQHQLWLEGLGQKARAGFPPQP
jgi:uncharacterized protein YndB with AHSA1/START domain